MINISCSIGVLDKTVAPALQPKHPALQPNGPALQPNGPALQPKNPCTSTEKPLHFNRTATALQPKERATAANKIRRKSPISLHKSAYSTLLDCTYIFLDNNILWSVVVGPLVFVDNAAHQFPA
jgi:hypothetical protein